MRSKVADVTGNVKYICKSVFRHQNVGGSTPQIFVWGTMDTLLPPAPPPMKEHAPCVPLALSCTHISPFAPFTLNACHAASYYEETS